MREPAVSKSETQFILASLSKLNRLDGRGMFEYRPISIAFGSEFGVCIASIGSTRALCQVTASLDRPPETRPNEGKIIFKIELPTLASPSFELGKNSPFAVELNRLLERAIVKSRCVDIEELCVRSGEKCWTLRVEVTALNNEGNLCDVLCLAAIGGLMHFRRPEVTIEGSDVTVHSPEEKAPIKLTLHHKPFTVTLGYIDGKAESTDEKIIILDPNRHEQNILGGSISVAVNKHREICALHLSGYSELSPDKILFCVKKATEKVSEMQQTVEKALKEDEKLRKKGIIPRLSTDIFDEPFDFDEIQSIVNEMETTNQNVKTESSETTTVKTEINDNSNEINQMTEPILIEDDVKLEETPSWNEIDKWIDDEPGDVEMSGDSSKKDVVMKDEDEDEDEEEPAGDVKSEFA